MRPVIITHQSGSGERRLKTIYGTGDLHRRALAPPPPISEKDTVSQSSVAGGQVTSKLDGLRERFIIISHGSGANWMIPALSPGWGVSDSWGLDGGASQVPFWAL